MLSHFLADAGEPIFLAESGRGAPHLWQRERFVRDVLEFTGHSPEPLP